MNARFTTRIYRLFMLTVVLASMGLLTACSSGGDGTAAANPTGYYTGDAAVFDANGDTLPIDDLQGLVNGNRFMAMSEIEELLYDGTITSISGNDFSATVKVYKEGALVVGSPTSFTGRISQGSQITGTFSGSGVWRGTFTLVYEQTNNVASSLATVASAVGEYWGGSKDFTYDSTDPKFQLGTDGTVIQFDAVGGGNAILWFLWRFDSAG